MSIFSTSYSDGDIAQIQQLLEVSCLAIGSILLNSNRKNIII